MSLDEERFMAFEGLLQWTYAVILQARRVSSARDRLRIDIRSLDLTRRHEVILNTHIEDHFFAVAANKLIEYKNWAMTFGLCKTINFGEINRFQRDIKIIRNMREHIVDYFQGYGLDEKRWRVKTRDYDTDASCVVGSKIGGRLDWVQLGTAAERLLPKLLAEPIPYPSHPARPKTQNVETHSNPSTD